MPDRSNAREILVSLRQELATVTGLGLARVTVSVQDDGGPHYLADQDIVIVPLEEPPGQPSAYVGGGRVVDLRTRRVKILARTRCLLDPAGVDQARLLDLTLGHLVLEDRIYNTCQCWFPDDGAGRLLLCEPAKTGTWSRPKQERDNPEWVSSSLEVELTYLRQLDLTRGV
jgi:hypothetical protein